MLDYYGLPEDFPGMTTRPPGAPQVRVAHVEARLAELVDDPRFLPHLTLHELEAWVFVDPAACSWLFKQPEVARELARIRDAVGGPELIDDGPETSPSRRLKSLYPAYQKVLHGPMTVRQVGIAAVKSGCPHAAAWLHRLETL
jgi:hypothetical protein